MLLLCAACRTATYDPDHPDLALDCVSDYVSFVGRDEPAGDLYFHDYEGGFLADFGGSTSGFLVDGPSCEPFDSIRWEERPTRQALGFYRWPRAWRGTFGRGHAFDLESVTRDVITNWVVGGYAMAIVRGTLTMDGERRPAYGWAELLE